MKQVTCEIVQDLLPLYCDGVCSEDSRALIQSHMESCDKCRAELHLMEAPAGLEADTVEIDTAEAASKLWKRSKRSAFRRGILAALVVVLILGMVSVGSFLGRHYRYSYADGDWEGLQSSLLYGTEITALNPIAMTARKGGYLAIACSDSGGLWYVGIFAPDSVFPNRWNNVGGLFKVRPGKLANWNHQLNGNDTVLVCFGAELPEDITGYTFHNSGVTYTCQVKDRTFLDFFFMPDSYDSKTILEPIRN